VASAGSCFAANIVPALEAAGYEYIRRETVPDVFGPLSEDNFSYAKFSAAYGNVYTSRQMLQLLKRALGKFKPIEDRWHIGPDTVADPFRPGLRYPASSDREFDLLTQQHLSKVLEVVRDADVFIFTLGLTEAWVSAADGAVYPACPGTVAGHFDPARHRFANFSVTDVYTDLSELISLMRSQNRTLRFILTVSPVPLVATACPDKHVLLATTYSKSVLRVAAEMATQNHEEVVYFPAYELVTGPQAPKDFFEKNRREPSAAAIDTVMRAFLANCEGHSNESTKSQARGAAGASTRQASPELAGNLSRIFSDYACEEAAADQSEL
jgi:hypothetical protein